LDAAAAAAGTRSSGFASLLFFLYNFSLILLFDLREFHVILLAVSRHACAATKWQHDAAGDK
jgi:hypothetical protein